MTEKEELEQVKAEFQSMALREKAVKLFAFLRENNITIKKGCCSMSICEGDNEVIIPGSSISGADESEELKLTNGHYTYDFYNFGEELNTQIDAL